MSVSVMRSRAASWSAAEIKRVSITRSVLPSQHEQGQTNQQPGQHRLRHTREDDSWWRSCRNLHPKLEALIFSGLTGRLVEEFAELLNAECR